MANHKGSLFGSPNLGDQPSQKVFENTLYQQTQKLDISQPIFIEAESSRIGKLFCPPSLWKVMKSAKVIAIDMPFQSRVECILKDYDYFISQPDEIFSLLDNLKRLRGNEQVQHWKQLAEEKQWNAFVSELLENHYDLSYKKAGTTDSSYTTPLEVYPLKGCSQEDFDAAAIEILAC